jgi:hypothetical protein
MSTDTERAAAFSEWMAAATHNTYSHEHAFNAGAQWGQARAAIAQPAEPSEVDRLNAERLDLAMLIIRLCQRMRAAREGRGIAAGDDALEQQALGYLTRKGIVGSPLRADGDEAQADAQPVAPKPDGRLHQDGYFTWAGALPGYVRDRDLPCDFWLKPLAAPPARQPLSRPLADWHEDVGDVLWWRFPIEEAPYVGHPNCDNWPGYHTHWTPLVLPDGITQEGE